MYHRRAQARWTRSEHKDFARCKQKELPLKAVTATELPDRAGMEWPVLGETTRHRLVSTSSQVAAHKPGEHVVPFGKWQHSLVKDVPNEYLRFLCLWNNFKTKQKTLLDSDTQQWLWRYHPETVHAARKYVKMQNMCRVCFRPLVPIGFDRANGKAHADWVGRQYHKQCWRELSTDSESDEDM